MTVRPGPHEEITADPLRRPSRATRKPLSHRRRTGGPMAGLEKKRFEDADETRPFADKGHVEIVTFGDGVVGRATFQPGWKWSEHVKPIVGTDSCQAAHFGYVVSGRQVVQMDDGSELEISAGDIVSIPPGHDGWTVGDEPCVVLDFVGMADYAK